MFYQAVFAGIRALIDENYLPKTCSLNKIVAEPTKDPAHGDLTTNAPIVLSGQARISPITIAGKLIEKIQKYPEFSPYLASINTAGLGFINVKLTPLYWQKQLKTILDFKEYDGWFDLGKGASVNVEYVSVNPTGPLHPGHGRIAVVADVLANILEKVGYRVTREYYVNDAGKQVDILARSTYLRYCEALGRKISEIPPGCYPGEYLKDIANALIAEDGTQWLDQPESVWKERFQNFTVNYLMVDIKKDLADLGIYQDVFFSELDLHRDGSIQTIFEKLESQNLVYEGTLPPPKGNGEDEWEPISLPLFRSTKFGDDIDRPLKKATGEWTYFAADIAYHMNKFQRNFSQMINVWGADHGSHVKRTKAAVEAITKGQAKLTIVLCQMVSFCQDGTPIKLSKRDGTFVSLRDVVEKVGKDVFRFMMLTRKPDSHFEFDLAKACEQTKDNPVFYVQYAHARACSVLRMVSEIFPDITEQSIDNEDVPYHLLENEEELALMKCMVQWPEKIQQAASSLEPHRLAIFLYALASAFHGLWAKGSKGSVLRFITPDNRDLTLARVSLVRGVLSIIASGLKLFGVQPIKEMR